MNTRNNSPIRVYRPKPGQLVKMSEWTDYTSRGLSPWGYLRVIGSDKDTATVRYAPNPTDKTQDGEQFTIPLYVVDMPIGWHPRYTIHAEPQQAKQIVDDWFNRGIVVRQSHDMSGSMPTAFQPLTEGTAEVPGSPHWQFPENTDVIAAEDCKRLFKVVAVEVEEVTSATIGYPAKQNCTLCAGTGRRSIANLAHVRGETAEEVRANAMDREEYFKLTAEQQSGKIPLENYSAASDTFRCHCHSGAVRDMGRTERGKLFKAMRAEGWEVEWVPYAGGFWKRRRETVVHEWEV